MSYVLPSCTKTVPPINLCLSSNHYSILENRTRQTRPNKINFQKSRRRVGHSPQAVDTPYSDLLDVDIAWKGLGSLRYPNDPTRNVQQTLDRLTGDTRYLFEIDQWHRRMMDNGHQFYPIWSESSFWAGAMT